MEKLTVLSRTYCHLCDDLIAALQAYLTEQGADAMVDVVDIDVFPEELEATWGDKVPVLLAGENRREICHYFFDRAGLDAYFAEVRNRVTAA